MQELFIQYISQENLFTPKDHLLVAVSGGVDSVVLCNLLYKAGYSFAIAHCNFQLRGDESGRDETFVRELAKKYNTPLYIKKFDTQTYAAQHKVSIQVAARELRYSWFKEVLQNELTAGANEKKYLVTAHHLDDNVETLLMNFFKGTGIAGLHGILPKKENIARPLLFLRKENIRKYALEENINWVEDSSNALDKYSRNYFRQQIIPLVENIFPEAFKNIADNINRFRDIETLYNDAIQRQKKKLLLPHGNEWQIPALKLQNTPAGKTVLYDILQSFNFTSAQTNDVWNLLQSESGKYVCSNSHRVLRNRSWLVISPLVSEEAQTILIEKPDKEIPYKKGIITFSHTNNISIKTCGDIAQLDASLITFPLLLRKWKQGDYFYPLGMKKKKKLSRFLIDQKISLTDKEKVWVLEMNKKIIWVIGMRIDDRFKITEKTKEVLEVRVN